MHAKLTLPTTQIFNCHRKGVVLSLDRYDQCIQCYTRIFTYLSSPSMYYSHGQPKLEQQWKGAGGAAQPREQNFVCCATGKLAPCVCRNLFYLAGETGCAQFTWQQRKVLLNACFISSLIFILADGPHRQHLSAAIPSFQLRLSMTVQVFTRYFVHSNTNTWDQNCTKQHVRFPLIKQVR